MKTVKIFLSAVLFILCSAYAWAGGASTKFVDEESFPTGWTKPEVTVNNGTVAVTPSVPSGFKKTDLGASLEVKAADITKYENIPIIERLEMVEFQELKNEFKFTKITDAQTVSGVQIEAMADIKGKAMDLVFQPEDVIYLKAVPYKIKSVRRAYEPDQEDAKDGKEEAKREEDQKEAVILQSEDGKISIVAELNKNILPAIYKIKFTDKYSKNSFFVPCPGFMKVQDADGRLLDTYEISGLENGVLSVTDSKGKTYKFTKAVPGK